MFRKSWEGENRELYSLDVLCLRDEADSSQTTLYDEFNRNITKNQDGRFKIMVKHVIDYIMRCENCPKIMRPNRLMIRLLNYDLKTGSLNLPPQTLRGNYRFYAS